jgi:hypothetical protein
LVNLHLRYCRTHDYKTYLLIIETLKGYRNPKDQLLYLVRCLNLDPVLIKKLEVVINNRRRIELVLKKNPRPLN